MNFWNRCFWGRKHVYWRQGDKDEVPERAEPGDDRYEYNWACSRCGQTWRLLDLRNAERTRVRALLAGDTARGKPGTLSLTAGDA